MADRRVSLRNIDIRMYVGLGAILSLLLVVGCLGINSLYSIVGTLERQAGMADGAIAANQLGGFRDVAFHNLLAAGTAAVLAALIAAVMVKKVLLPVGKIASVMTAIAEGNREVEIPFLDGADALAQIAKAAESLKEKANKTDDLLQSHEQQKLLSQQEQKSMMQLMADTFQGQVGIVIDAVRSATVELRVAAKKMESTADETTTKATSVAAAAEESSGNVQAVASSAEELSSSIQEISRQVEQTRKVAFGANEKTAQTMSLFRKLSDDANSIGEIVSLINNIASQTNLLALNATIEAARAGEVGKGFAVVASEVKSLANQTAKATEEVSTKIGLIQNGTNDAVAAVDSIAKMVSEMTDISGSVATAVSQQSAATGEITRNVEQASTGTNEVSRNISSVEGAAKETGAAATQIASSADELFEQSDRLTRAVSAFLEMLRSA